MGGRVGDGGEYLRRLPFMLVLLDSWGRDRIRVMVVGSKEGKVFGVLMGQASLGCASLSIRKWLGGLAYYPL